MPNIIAITTDVTEITNAEGSRASRDGVPEMDADTMKIAKESLVLAVLGTIDLITDDCFHRASWRGRSQSDFSFFLGHRTARVYCRQNPAHCLPAFWCWNGREKRNPRFVQMGMRSAIAGYVAMYGFGFLHLNGPGADARDVVAAQISYNIETGQNVSSIEDTRMIEERETPGVFGAQSVCRSLSSCRQKGKNTAPAGQTYISIDFCHAVNKFSGASFRNFGRDMLGSARIVSCHF